MDDSDVVLDLYTSLFEKEGYISLKASTCRDALEIYKQNMETIDLCIMDLILPDLNGILCAAEIRRMNPIARIIATTGTRMPAEELKEKGFEFILYKPWDIQDFMEIIKQVE